MSIFLILVHFVCPLIFFTNFTRNPYQTQITLLNLSVIAFFVIYLGRFFLRLYITHNAQRGTRNSLFRIWPVLLPLAAFTLVAVASVIVSYFRHPAFFRSSIFNEGLRVHLFWLINVLGALIIGLISGANMLTAKDKQELFELDTPTLWAGVFFALSWLGYRSWARPNPPSAEGSLWAYIWDPYGFFIWLGLLSFLIWRWRRESFRLLITLNFFVGLLAAIYGIGQYFGYDAIWPRALNPYGSRAVSTFGNPNFLSSYLAILFPLALAGFLTAGDLKAKSLYGFFCLTYEAGLIVTLTRSSWMGALSGVLIVGIYFLKRLREPKYWRRTLCFGVLCGLLFLFWPKGASGGSPTPINRLLEFSQTFQASAKGGSASGGKEDQGYYGPSYQRLLIWSVVWKFVEENPLLGKGWGMLELFYPFYQSELFHQTRFRGLRTHANNAHNEIFEIWSQTGILGMGIFVWFLATLGFWSHRQIKSSKEGSLKALSVGLLAGLIAMLVDNLLNVSLHFAMPAYLFWWNMGLLIAIQTSELRPQSLDLSGKAIGVQIVAGIGLLLLFFGGYKLTSHFTRHWLSEFYYFRGLVLHREGKFDLALNRLLASYKYFPMEVNKAYELGNVYARLGVRDSALWAYDEALKANAGYDEVYFNKAALLYEMGRHEEALNNYKVSLSINPINRISYVALTSLFLKDEGRSRQEAISWLTQALRYFPEDPEFSNNLGSFYLGKKEYEAAAQVFLNILKINPQYASARNNLTSLVRFFLASREYSKASIIVDKWRQIDPSVPSLTIP